MSMCIIVLVLLVAVAVVLVVLVVLDPGRLSCLALHQCLRSDRSRECLDHVHRVWMMLMMLSMWMWRKDMGLAMSSSVAMQ